jgi:hypothetical protein
MSTRKARGYTGVWRPGDWEERWISGGLSLFKAKDDELFAKGFRLTAFDRHPEPGDGMIGVWRPGSGEQRWRSGMSVSDFKAQDATYFTRGLRLTAVDSHDGEISAVWRPGDGAQYWDSGLSGSELHDKDLACFKQGLRLSSLDIDNGKAFAVWRPGSGAQRWFSGPYAEFVAKNDAFVKEGLRLVALDHRGGHYAGVWRPGSGLQYWYTGLTFAGFKAKGKELKQQGLRLHAVDLGWRYVEIPDPPEPDEPPDDDDGPTPDKKPPPKGTLLSLSQNEPYTGPGGNSGWMYYEGKLNAPLGPGTKLTTVKNMSSFELLLTHAGPSSKVAAGGQSSAFANQAPTGTWKAQLLGVTGNNSPLSITLDLDWS